MNASARLMWKFLKPRTLQEWPKGHYCTAGSTTTSRAAGEQLLSSVVNFNDTKVAYKNKSTGQLLRAYFVFRMCTFNYIVDRQMNLIYWTHKLVGQSIFKKLMAGTIYGQFMGGETNNDVLKRAEHHRQHGVYPMFQFTARETHGVPPQLKAISRFSDDIILADLCDENVTECLNAIELGSLSQNDNMYSIVTTKVTFYGCTQLMEKVNSVMKYNFSLFDANPPLSSEIVQKAISIVCTKLMNVENIEKGLPNPSAKQIKSKNTEALLHSVAFHLQLHETLQDLCTQLPIECLSDSDVAEVLNIWNRLHSIGLLAKQKSVTLGIDAEQTYLQVFFDLLTLDLMRVCNTEKPLVQNTYQTYLKHTNKKVERHANLADSEGFKFGCRIVRGGYMDEERNLAVKHNYEDPVNPSYEATTKMYYKTAHWLANRVKSKPPGNMRVLFATHNEDTVKYILSLVKELGIKAEEQSVSVAQLLGMRDHVSFTLGHHGFPVHKLIHYGEIQECVAYLSRRMKENRSGMTTADHERQMLATELRRRLLRQ